MATASKRWLVMLITVLLASCARRNFLIATPDNCTPVNQLRITKECKAVVNATLMLKVDARRRKYDARGFCAYNQPTSNKKYYLITIYDKIGNHMSPTWMLMGNDFVVDTQLNSYQMTSDSLRTNDKIIIGVTRLSGIDSLSRKELIQMMQKDARDYRKH